MYDILRMARYAQDVKRNLRVELLHDFIQVQFSSYDL